MTDAQRLVPKELSINDVFADGAYSIPVYQRNYAWRSEQIEQLIRDIQDALSGKDEGYFLGNLVVTYRQRTRDYEVIDGQQRLTTLHLLLTCLGSHPLEGRGFSHQDSLRFDARPRATEALRRVATESSRHATGTGESTSGADTGIHEGYRIIQQYMEHRLSDGARRRDFHTYLLERVKVVRVQLPSGTDLNRYFEVMNTRGQQLQQVDILKARLLSRLPDPGDRRCFARIWDACADMDSYVQMSLTRNDTKLRAAIFGPDWSELSAESFAAVRQAMESGTGEGQSSDGGVDQAQDGALGLDAAIHRYMSSQVSESAEDPDNVRFRSTIEFPSFLLHALAVFSDSRDSNEAALDDKKLVARFTPTAGEASAMPEGELSSAASVMRFGYTLLLCRHLFDAFILKRQYTATNGEEGDWSLRRLIRRESLRGSGKQAPGYVNTYAASEGQDEPQDEQFGAETSNLLLIESMLRVTYTSPRTMRWITELLKVLVNRHPRRPPSNELVQLLRNYARAQVREVFLDAGEPEGFAINRIVFTYLDYVMLMSQGASGYRFGFRNSIEHFFPQHPDEGQEGDRVSEVHRNLLGNLALVSVGANSKFSNSLPRVKAENYRKTVVEQSPKLQRMADIARKDGWGDEQVEGHHLEMINLLRMDCTNDG